MRDFEIREVNELSPLDGDSLAADGALPNSSASMGASSSGADGPRNGKAADGTTALPDNESRDYEPVAGNNVEVTMPDGNKVLGTVAYETGGLYCVAAGDEWHKGVKRSDLRVIL